MSSGTIQMPAPWKMVTTVVLEDGPLVVGGTGIRANTPIRSEFARQRKPEPAFPALLLHPVIKLIFDDYRTQPSRDPPVVNLVRRPLAGRLVSFDCHQRRRTIRLTPSGVEIR
jgi:hypothetical protein